MKNNNKERLFEVMGKVNTSFKPKLNETYGTPDPLGSHKAKQISEESPKGGGVNPKYSHFAVLKNISPEVNGKIVNGWDYSGYDPAELREFKRDYFMEDIKDMQINPKNVNIVTTKHLQKMGINPFDFNYWYLSQNPENQKFNELIYTQ